MAKQRWSGDFDEAAVESFCRIEIGGGVMATLSLFYGILVSMRPEDNERHKSEGKFFKIDPLR